ncbi:hypothetical protein HNQ92_002144 [Rhabdobacter roseus]|uniref:Uncharacterized protein n=1 Tax=Rhabdobacter roseus TaxID=1655419 RepID=A0A840TKJ3_9BACT|nr:hypothetical protein [Rhabdobacter roseus]
MPYNICIYEPRIVYIRYNHLQTITTTLNPFVTSSRQLKVPTAAYQIYPLS